MTQLHYLYHYLYLIILPGQLLLPDDVVAVVGLLVVVVGDCPPG